MNNEDGSADDARLHWCVEEITMEKIKTKLLNAETISKVATFLHFTVAVGLVLFLVGFWAIFRGSHDLIAFTVPDMLLLLIMFLIMALVYGVVFWFVTQAMQHLKQQQTALEQRVEHLGKENAMLGGRADTLEQAKTALEQKMEQLGKENAMLGGKADTLEQTKTALEQRVENLDKENVMLEQAKATLEREVEYLQQKTVADYRLRIEGGIVMRGREEIELPLKEFMLLKCLMQKEGGLCTYDEIIEYVWPDVGGNSSYVNQDVHQLVKRLRKTLVVSHDYIRSFGGRGYGFVQWSGSEES